MEVDFVCLGSGIGGLSGAITAAESGLTVAVFEKSAKVGGVTAYSSGLLWVAGNHVEARLGLTDSWQSGQAYLMQISAGFAMEEAARAFCQAAPVAAKFLQRAGLHWQIPRGLPDYYFGVVPDGRPEGRYLEVAPFDAAVLGEWSQLTQLSPYSQYRTTNAHRFNLDKTAPRPRRDAGSRAKGRQDARDVRCMGPGLAAALVKAALDRSIPLHRNTEAKALVLEGDRVVGVRVEQGGRNVFVRGRRGVLIAMSGYDWNDDLVSLFDHRPDWGSRSPVSVTGDHFRLAGAVGAKVARVPNYTTLGFAIPGEMDSEGQPLWRRIEVGKPHAILVNGRGKRFADESFYLAITKALDIVDSSTQIRPNYPCWAIFDSEHVRRYGIGAIARAKDLPSTVVATGRTIAELGSKLGIDAQGLTSEVRKFNSYAKQSVDRDYGRGENPWSRLAAGDSTYRQNPNLGGLSKPPFYGIRMSQVLIGIPSAGLVGDSNGRVVNYSDEPVAGLYVAGNSMALLEIGNGYQSGVANARGMTYGFLAARHAAQLPGKAAILSSAATKAVEARRHRV